MAEILGKALFQCGATENDIEAMAQGCYLLEQTKSLSNLEKRIAELAIRLFKIGCWKLALRASARAVAFGSNEAHIVRAAQKYMFFSTHQVYLPKTFKYLEKMLPTGIKSIKDIDCMLAQIGNAYNAEGFVEKYIYVLERRVELQNVLPGIYYSQPPSLLLGFEYNRLGLHVKTQECLSALYVCGLVPDLYREVLDALLNENRQSLLNNILTKIHDIVRSKNISISIRKEVLLINAILHFEHAALMENEGFIFDALQMYKNTLKLCLQGGKGTLNEDSRILHFISSNEENIEKVAMKFNCSWCRLYIDSMQKISKMHAFLGSISEARKYERELQVISENSRLLEVAQLNLLWQADLSIFEDDIEEAARCISLIQTDSSKSCATSKLICGRVEHSRKNFNVAKDYFESALDIAGISSRTKSKLFVCNGKNYMKIGHDMRASEEFKKCIAVKDGCVMSRGEAFFHLALLSYQSTDLFAALGYIQEAFTLVKSTDIPWLLRDVKRLYADLLFSQQVKNSEWQLANLIGLSVGLSHINFARSNNQTCIKGECGPDELKELISTKLPLTWTVVTLAISPTGNLSISRLMRDSIPVTKFVALNKGLLSCLKEEWKAIMNNNKESLRCSSYKIHNCSSNEKARWWIARENVNKGIHEFTIRLQEEFFHEVEVRNLLLGKLEQYDDTVQLDAYSIPSESDMMKLTVKQLKHKLDRLGIRYIRMKGKSQLVKCLHAAQLASRQIISPQNESKPLLDKIDRHPVILILDENLHEFPFESLSCLAGQPITRLPALPFLFSTDNSKRQMEKGIYILDPESNLPSTRERLAPVLGSFAEKRDWIGYVGQIPIEENVYRELTNRDVFVYCGHGAGERIIKRDVISKLNICATSILMGCSSGRMKGTAYIEPVGMVSAYIIAGCPLVVANLWDVTDKDIDRFSISLLGSIASVNSQNNKTLAHFVSDARNSCKMKFVVGFSPVCYGIPVNLV